VNYLEAERLTNDENKPYSELSEIEVHREWGRVQTLRFPIGSTERGDRLNALRQRFNKINRTPSS